MGYARLLIQTSRVFLAWHRLTCGGGPCAVNCLNVASGPGTRRHRSLLYFPGTGPRSVQEPSAVHGSHWGAPCHQRRGVVCSAEVAAGNADHLHGADYELLLVFFINVASCFARGFARSWHRLGNVYTGFVVFSGRFVDQRALFWVKLAVWKTPHFRTQRRRFLFFFLFK